MSDFRRFYQLNLPAALHEYEPSFLTGLLDGLEGIDGSLYRAWSLEHDDSPKPEKDGDETPTLSYLAYSQDSMVRLDTRNTLELIRVMLAHYMGDKKAEPSLILPPGAEPAKRSGRVHESLDLSQATAETMLAFLMKTT